MSDRSTVLAACGFDNEAEQRRTIVRFGRWLYRLGFMPGTSGNLSVRLGDGRILATPTGCSKYLLKAADMVTVDLEGNQLSGAKKVTSEIGMHLAIYRMRDDVKAVVHAHPPIATGFACAGRALDQPLCAEAVMSLGPVPLAPYATTGTDQLAASLRPLIPDHHAILMANHGAVTYGDNLLDSFLKMETLEHFAHICLVADRLGTPRLLEKRAVGQLLHAKDRYLQNCKAG
ncbi:MAG TPA: class II aldolase/adducin family protein [Acidobacteriaceae bacterium]|nr:class II aldolase/adducin family protein [Acidobacteriaceae bacterium]